MDKADRLIPLLLMLLLALAAAGCKSLAERRKDAALEIALSSYRTAMRWGDWDGLLSLRHPQAPPLSEDVHLDDVRVVSYEIRQPPVPIKKGRVGQVAEIRYVMTDEQRVRKLYDKQEWRYDAAANQWRLYSPLPEFR